MIGPWLIAAPFAFIAGFALARGGICAVAAVRHVIEAGRWALFLSFLECAAWALLALIAADAFGVMALGAWPARMSLAAALVGGAVFGVGALVNGACAFGSAGRLAAGELSFLAFIPGFMLGVSAAHALGAAAQPAEMAIAIGGVALVALTFGLVLFALWRGWTLLRSVRTSPRLAASLMRGGWPPALAMAVIALANVGLLLLVISWPYTSVLADIALGRDMQNAQRAMLVLIFLVGAWSGAATAGRFKLQGATWSALGARFGGGVLMGLGAAMIPGGNDSLVLIGLPLLQPSAFVAYAAMIAVIAAGFLAQRALAKRQPAQLKG